MNADMFVELIDQARAAKPEPAGKKRLKVSFSGGKSSGTMRRRLEAYKDEFDIMTVFCNTGQESEETLRFVNRCDVEFGFNTVWLEAAIDPEAGAGTRHKIVTFETASRQGEPYEAMTAKYGVSNRTFQPCNRELKLAPMKSYMDSIGWEPGSYYTAIGIRPDEDRRVNEKAAQEKILYPLIDMFPMDKQDINDWWEEQPFTLNLLEHQGNCKWCWKKSDAKLLRLIAETPEIFDFPRRMEQEHGFSGAPYYGKPPEGARPRVFFRQHRSTNDMFALAEEIEVLKARQLTFSFNSDEDAGCSESCEAYEMAA